MQHNSIDICTYISECTHIGPHTLFTSEQEQNIKQYIVEMNDIGLSVSKQDVIKLASDLGMYIYAYVCVVIPMSGKVCVRV